MPPTAPPASSPTDAAGLLKELTDRGLPTANLRNCSPAGLKDILNFIDMLGSIDAPTSRDAAAQQMSERREIEKLRQGYQSFAEQAAMPPNSTVESIIAGFKVERKYNPRVTAADYLTSLSG